MGEIEGSGVAVSSGVAVGWMDSSGAEEGATDSDGVAVGEADSVGCNAGEDVPGSVGTDEEVSEGAEGAKGGGVKRWPDIRDW